MKTRLLVILFVPSILFPASNVFAPPSPNEWPAAPYCPGGCSIDYLKEKWSEYYDYKGSEWMEARKQEMLNAMSNGTLNEWLNADPMNAHYNVHAYYFYKGEIPNHEGKFIDQVAQEIFLSDMENSLQNNRFPLGEHMYVNFTFLLTVIGGSIVGIIFAIRRKRK
ncbi:MAG TPA: hypothetical protein VGA92_05570 [Candidatus Nitrosotenuis sp.]|jgi:hypothetical protein